MLDGSREIPKEYRGERGIPGLAPGCKFSARARTQAVSLQKAHEREYLDLWVTDLQEYVIPEALQHIAGIMVEAERKMKKNIPEEEGRCAQVFP